jgi:hypothetical protein
MAYINLGIMYLERPEPRLEEARRYLDRRFAWTPRMRKDTSTSERPLQRMGRLEEARQSYATPSG